jgi:hypothetical protein
VFAASIIRAMSPDDGGRLHGTTTPKTAILKLLQ